jgi:hypothetical protein
MKINNAKQPPQVYYGLHFCAGAAEYQEKGIRILINEATAKEMDPTFRGRPVFVGHRDNVTDEMIENDADGYVVRSFYNPADGMHWAEFIVVTDRGHEAIRRGFRLSNAYEAENFGSGGQWHAIDYHKEVLKGKYDHLAIVDDPRYEESVILRPEEFKQYNERKKLELEQLKNSKGKSHMGLKFWKRTKVENAKEIDLENIVVELPESKKEVTIAEAVASADKFENMQGYANGDHMVKVGDEEMSVNDLSKKYVDMCNTAKAESEGKELENGDDDMAEDDEEMENEATEGDALGEEKDAKLHPKNSKVKEKEEPKKKDSGHFKALKNAHHNASDEEPETIELMCDKVARGKSRYGSK